METIREPFDNSADASPVVFFFFPSQHTHTQPRRICILFTYPRAILDSVLYLSEETFILAIARTIRITPGGVVVDKIRRFADTASFVRAFRYAPRARIRPDSENIRFASRWAKSGRDRGRGGESERDSAIIKESEQMADVGAALK